MFIIIVAELKNSKQNMKANDDHFEGNKQKKYGDSTTSLIIIILL